VRPGGATRGKWRIPDEKVGSGLFSYSELSRWQASPVSIEDRSSGPVNKIDYVLGHTTFMGSHKHSSFDGHTVG
jgi:hypothetical protein